jgi:hypothetical protein
MDHHYEAPTPPMDHHVLSSIPPLITTRITSGPPIPASKELWSYAYESGLSLSINATVHFTTYLQHSPEIVAIVGRVPMLKVGSLDTANVFGFLTSKGRSR